MFFILSILVNAAVILLIANLMESVSIRSYTTALWVALVIGLLNATIGFLFRLPLNIITLFLITFIVRVIVTAIMVKFASYLFEGFKVRGFTPALIISLSMAIAGVLLKIIF